MDTMQETRVWYAKNSDEVLREFDVDPSRGLSESEANSRLAHYGLNRLVEKKRRSVIVLFVRQMNNVLVFILVAAALISALLGELSDSLIIAAVILLNAVIGVIQESKAEKAVQELKKLSTPNTVVKRDGTLMEIPSEQVVPGDIVVLDAGRVVPCDMRLVESVNLRIEESALTGESVPVEKNSEMIVESGYTALGDRRNMAFMSTIATYGRGIGVAVATGMNTQIGRIATMLEEEEDERTPLQKKLDRFARLLGLIVLALCGLMFGISVSRLFLQSGSIPKESLFEFFLTAVSLAVAAIPEGLPTIISIVLALGVQRMIRQNAIVRRLPAVETLGSVNIICTDKTGTLTQNRMTVKRFSADGKGGELEGIDVENPVHRMLLESLVLCNDAGYSPAAAAGDPTEVALLEAGFRFGITKEKLLRKWPRVYELPFDSVRKRMSTVHADSRGTHRMFTKGAPNRVLELCRSVYTSEGIVPLTLKLKREIERGVEDMSEDALRVLGAAFKEALSEGGVEKDMVFLGCVGMIDPPRLEVKDSIARCFRAGVRTVMITGDHRHTAHAIARELGIAEAPSEVIDGSELDTLSDEELSARLHHLRVFARVSPEHKVRIVRAMKERGHIVSMTGDGVNDAPSLRAADIGVAMGKSGTDVAKGAADMILTDDNFETIVSAVEEGRNIFRNIKKTIVFLLSSNAGEFISVFTAMLLGWPPLLLPIHILWVNLVTDTLPALSLGIDPGNPDVLEEPPRDPSESLFARGAGANIITNGLLIGILTLVAFRIGLHLSGGSIQHARTVAFAVLAISQLFHAFNLRHTSKSLFQVGIFGNRPLVGSFLVCSLLQLAVIGLPQAARVFKVQTLSAGDWGLVVGISFLPILFNEIAKGLTRIFIMRKQGKRAGL